MRDKRVADIALDALRDLGEQIDENQVLRAELSSLRLSTGDFAGNPCCETCGDGPLEVGHVEDGYHFCERCYREHTLEKFGAVS